MLRTGVALVACIAVAVMALHGHEAAPPGIPPEPVELAIAEDRLRVVDGSKRERGSEPRRAAVRRYEPARRDRKRRTTVRRRPQASLPASHGVLAVAGAADPAAVVPRARGDEQARARRAPSAGGQQRQSGAAPRGPRQDAAGGRGALAPDPVPPPPPPPPPPAAAPAAPTVSVVVDEPSDDAAEEPDDDAGELPSDD